jgi:diaminopimelate decarboxylase
MRRMQMRTDAELLSLFASGTRRDDDGGLRIAGCRVDELAETYGTPLMVVDEGHLRATVRAFKQGLEARLPSSVVTFASKAFPCTAVYRLMADEGVGVDVAGGGELALALAGGVDPATIVLHGNAKSDAEIAAADAAGVGLVVVDNLDDLDRLERIVTREQGVLVRITPGVEGATHASISTGGLDAKFGLPIDQAAVALRRAASSPLLRVDGVHIHIGSQILEAEPFAESVHALAALLEQEDLGPFPVYDLGGGLGARYTYDDAPATVAGYLDALAGAAREVLPGGARVIIEPGRALVANSTATIYRVVTHKRTGRDFVAVDGGMGDNLEVSLFGQRFEVAHAARPLGAGAVVCDLVGRHCESGDRLIEDALLPETAVGDLLAVPVTGAYCFTMSNNYNGALRPPVVFAHDGAHRAVVRRETHADLMARDLA